MKVFILGIDGATFDVIFDKRLKDKLPNLNKLIKTGSYGDLKSTIHPLTPQAWTTFLTGVNPGKHGVFDFSKRKINEYNLTLTNSCDRRTPSLWDHLKQANKSCGIMNIPLTFPPPYNMNGFMLTGMHTPKLERGYTPSTDLNEFKKHCPDYIIDVLSNWFNSKDEFLENVHKMLKARERSIKYLYKKYKPDCMAAVIVAADRIQHCLWKKGMDKELISLCSNKYKNEIINIYAEIDRTVGNIVDMLDKDTTLIIVSDHGFGSLEKEVSLNRFLIEAGFMKLNGKKILKPIKNPLLRKIKEFNVWNGNCPSEKISFDTIDWQNTVAYSYGLFGNICLNIKGREPLGIVDINKDFHKIINRIIRALNKIKYKNDKVVDFALPAGALYNGNYVKNAPDIIIKMKDYSFITRGGFEFSSNKIIHEPMIDHTGNHRMNGVFIANGPNIKKNYKFLTAQIKDVLPTILSLMNIQGKDWFDGRILKEIILDNSIIEKDRNNSNLNLAKSSTEQPDENIKKRLKALGYF